MLTAAGKIYGNFFEAVEVHAEKGIYANYSLNAMLYTEGKVYIHGVKGTIVGGITQAAKGVEVYSIGNRVGIETIVRTGVSESLAKANEDLKQKLMEIKEELTIFTNAYKDLQRKYSVEVRNTMELYLKIESAVSMKQEEFMELIKERNGKAEELNKLRNATVHIRGMIYEGVRVEICGNGWVATEVRNVTVRNVGQRIAVYQNKGSRR